MKKLLILILMFVMATSAIFAQNNDVITIVPFASQGFEQGEAETLTELFISEYAVSTKAQVADRSNFNGIIAQHKFQLTEWSNNEKVAKLGVAMNANKIICGRLATFGSKITFTVRLLDVNSTKILNSVTKTVDNPDELLNSLTKISKELAGLYYIGATGPGGGIIFYIEGDRGLEVSPWLGDYDWYDAKKVAKDYRGGGYDDWYLPNKAELNIIYQNLVKTGIIDVSQGNIKHWSSSQSDIGNAWCQRFSDGRQYNRYDYGKDLTLSVRAVRAF